MIPVFILYILCLNFHKNSETNKCSAVFLNAKYFMIHKIFNKTPFLKCKVWLCNPNSFNCKNNCSLLMHLCAWLTMRGSFFVEKGCLSRLIFSKRRQFVIINLDENVLIWQCLLIGITTVWFYSVFCCW